MRRQKIITLLTAICFSVCSFMPTIVLAKSAPPQRRAAHSQSIKRPAPRPSGSINKVNRPPRQVVRKQPVPNGPKRFENKRYPKRVFVGSHPRYRHDTRYYYYGNYRFPRRVYSGWYHHRHYTMHGDDWIAMIGTAAFFALLSNMSHSSDTVVLNPDGNVIYVD